MPSFYSILVSSIVSLLVGCISGWWITADYKDNHYTAIMNAQKAQAFSDAAEAATHASKLANQLEITHVQHQAELDKVLADNRALTRQLGGLRDPGYKPATCTVDTTSSVAIAPTEGRLSDEASQFLLDFARQADAAAEYANTCYVWIKELSTH